MDTSSRETQAGPLDALKYAVGTDVGRRREENQDSYGYLEQHNLKFYIVADGMGGAKGGATASNQAVKIVKETLSGVNHLGVPQLVAAIQKANSTIFELGSNDEALAGMGTTFVGLAFIGTSVAIVNVGDSRAYRMRGNSIFQLTSDHTLVNELLRTGAIGPDQVENHPVAHMLTRSLGPTGEVEVDCWVAEDGPARGDKYLLCSDGLYNLVPPTDILRIVRENSIDEAVTKLINLANDRGGTDNITVMIISIGEEFPLSVEDYALSQIEADEPELNVGHINEAPIGSAINGAASHLVEDIPAASPADSGPLTAPPEAATVGKPFTSKRPVQIGIASIGALLLVFVGTQIQKFTDRKTPAEQLIFNPLATTVAESVIDLSGKSGIYESPDLQLINLRAGSAGATPAQVSPEVQPDTVSYPSIEGVMSVQQAESVAKRREILAAQLIKIEARIDSFDKPLSGDLMERLKQIEQELQAQNTKHEELGAELDQATRKLSIWYGRRQRMQTADPVDLASEVSVSSSQVKEKKELFERATWAYLKEVEVWRLNPTDQELTKNVGKLGRDREQARRELGGEVRRAIDESKAASEREISELTAKRDVVQLELDNLNEEAKFIRVITSNNPVEKKSKKEELILERDQLAAELEELKNLAL